LFFVGDILKTKGNKGEVVLRLSPEFYLGNEENIDSLCLKSKKRSKILSVEWIKELGDDLTIKFSEIDTISEAYKLIGYSAHLDVQKDDTSFKKHSFIGYKVIDVDGSDWGIVINDEATEFTHTLERDDEGNVVYIQYSRMIVSKVNKKEQTIIINPPEGLRDLNK
jgi:ribosomal 30S subunit maturation factor RimM